MKFFITTLLSIFFVSVAYAETNIIIIKDGSISKSEIVVPENSNIEFTIKNLDENFDEFKSSALKLKLEHLPVNGEATFKLPPLKPGMYPFKVEFEYRSYSSKDKNIYGNIVVK